MMPTLVLVPRLWYEAQNQNPLPPPQYGPSEMPPVLLEASRAEIRPPYPLKEFVPKFNLPVLDRYDVSAPRNYWSYWPKNYKLDHEPNINYDLFREWEIDAGFEYCVLLEVVYSDLKFGAHIGCKGKILGANKV
jgi:hypothetical protein